MILKEGDTDQEDAQKCGPSEDGEFGVNSVRRTAREQLKEAPEDGEGQGDDGPRKSRGRKAGTPNSDRGEREYSNQVHIMGDCGQLFVENVGMFVV